MVISIAPLVCPGQGWVILEALTEKADPQLDAVIVPEILLTVRDPPVVELKTVLVGSFVKFTVPEPGHGPVYLKQISKILTPSATVCPVVFGSNHTLTSFPEFANAKLKLLWSNEVNPAKFWILVNLILLVSHPTENCMAFILLKPVTDTGIQTS